MKTQLISVVIMMLTGCYYTECVGPEDIKVTNKSEFLAENINIHIQTDYDLSNDVSYRIYNAEGMYRLATELISVWETENLPHLQSVKSCLYNQRIILIQDKELVAKTYCYDEDSGASGSACTYAEGPTTFCDYERNGWKSDKCAWVTSRDFFETMSYDIFSHEMLHCALNCAGMADDKGNANHTSIYWTTVLPSALDLESQYWI